MYNKVERMLNLHKMKWSNHPNFDFQDEKELESLEEEIKGYPEVITNSKKVQERLEEKLEEAITIQSRYTSAMMDPDLSRLIRVLEYVRGRRYIKCMYCGADLTLTLCDHHDRIRDGILPEDFDSRVSSLVGVNNG